MDVSSVIHKIMKDIRASGQGRSRFCLRLIPVQLVAKVTSVADVVAVATPLIKRAFLEDGTSPMKVRGGGVGTMTQADLQFAVEVKIRHNDTLKPERMAMIDAVASIVLGHGNPLHHSVSLTAADMTVMVWVVRTMACVSLLPEYHKLCQYNLSRVAGGLK